MSKQRKLEPNSWGFLIPQVSPHLGAVLNVKQQAIRGFIRKRLYNPNPHNKWAQSFPKYMQAHCQTISIFFEFLLVLPDLLLQHLHRLKHAQNLPVLVSNNQSTTRSRIMCPTGHKFFGRWLQSEQVFGEETSHQKNW